MSVTKRGSWRRGTRETPGSQTTVGCTASLVPAHVPEFGRELRSVRTSRASEADSTSQDAPYGLRIAPVNTARDLAPLESLQILQRGRLHTQLLSHGRRVVSVLLLGRVDSASASIQPQEQKLDLVRLRISHECPLS
jgi:hypothetical protein